MQLHYSKIIVSQIILGRTALLEGGTCPLLPPGISAYVCYTSVSRPHPPKKRNHVGHLFWFQNGEL